MEKQALWTRGFILTSVSNFFLFLTFYYLLVTLPVYAIESLGAGETGAGLLLTVFLISAIVTRPLTGIWISRFGEKRVYIVALTLFLVGAVLYFLPNSMMGLLLLRLFHGIGFGMATTAAGTIVANMIPSLRRGEGMGYFALFMNLAMVIGPFLGLTAMQDWGINVTFTIGTICAVLSLTIGLSIKLPKEEVSVGVTTANGKANFRFGDLFEVSAVKISLVGAFFALVYTSILSFVSVYAKQMDLVEVSSYFFVVFAAVLLLSRPFTGRWFDQYGANVIIYPALILFAIGMYLLSGADSAFIFLLAAGFIGLGWGTAFPSFQTIAIQEAAPARRGLATATFLTIFDIGMGFGSFIVGIIGSKIGLDSLYFYAAFLIFIGIGIYYLLHGKKESGKVSENVTAS